MDDTNSGIPVKKSSLLGRIFHLNINHGFLIFAIFGLVGLVAGLEASNCGAAICIAGGATATGALLGFLFGIPRVLQRSAASREEEGAPVTTSNTNLERISDWLTAIIIGASLVQIREIGEGLDSLASRVSNELGGAAGSGYTATYFGLLYFGIGGFIFAYLFTRIQLVRTFKATEDFISAQEKLEAEKQNSETRESVLIEQMERLTQGRTLEAESSARMDDSNKGRFGGKPEANGRALSARIFPLGGDSKYCRVELTVAGTPGRPLSGIVQFHLHETFKPHDVIAVVAVDNQARFSTVSWGAFTVGAVCDDGQTRLELDLSDPALRGPEDWRQR